jgi:hypothetical protein
LKEVLSYSTEKVKQNGLKFREKRRKKSHCEEEKKKGRLKRKKRQSFVFLLCLTAGRITAVFCLTMESFWRHLWMLISLVLLGFGTEGEFRES